MRRMRATRLLPLALPLALLLMLPKAQADGLADLKAALAQLQGSSAVRGTLQLRGESRVNEGKDDARIETSQAQIGVEDGPQGLRLLYPQAQLARARQEQEAFAKDPKASKPTAEGLEGLTLREAQALLRPVERLQQRLATAQFKSEKADSWQGQPARLLSFTLPMTQPNKHVKEHSHELLLWINADGVPLASRSTQKNSGRAYLVISFEIWGEEELQYAVLGERLVALRSSSKNGGSGGGERGQAQRTLTFTPG